MPSGKVTVLCPDGHTVTVKTDSKTPLLHILEESCRKRNLDPLSFALRRQTDQNRGKTTSNLDTSLTMYMSGLPNNCHLEIVAASSSNKLVKVKVALQVENQGRKVAEFDSNSSLFDVISQLYNNWQHDEAKEEEPVLIYMRKEIVGMDAIRNTSLKQLGLSQGSAAFRLLFRQPQVMKEQANVVDVKLTGEKKVDDHDEEKESSRPWRAMRKDNQVTLSDILPPKNPDDPMPPTSTPTPTSTSTPTPMPMPTTTKSQIDDSSSSGGEKSSQPPMETESEPMDQDDKEEIVKEPVILNYLDQDFHTVIYKLEDGVSRMASYDINDDFFDLTIEDAKVLMKDVRKAQQGSEEQVLMTRQMRQTIEEGKKLSLLNRYKRTVIRVQTQNRFIVQAIFLSGSKVKDVQELLKRYLDLDVEPQLFVTPPKTDLKAESTLLDCKCVPAALVYLKDPKAVVKSQVDLSNLTGAEKALTDSKVHKSRNSTTSGEQQGISSINDTMRRLASIEEEENNSSNGAQKRPAAGNPYVANVDKKLPKWFKPGGK